MPSEREGAGDGLSWYDWTLQEARRGVSEGQSPPYPIGTTLARREALSQIYEYVASRDPPPTNIASEAIQAYYPGVEARMVMTWANQVLCMISEYHMACVTRGSAVTSPIIPKAIGERLPPLATYSLPKDVRVRDHQAKTLRVAVWLHRLDMALSGKPAALGSLVQAQHP